MERKAGSHNHNEGLLHGETQTTIGGDEISLTARRCGHGRACLDLERPRDHIVTKLTCQL